MPAPVIQASKPDDKTLKVILKSEYRSEHKINTPYFNFSTLIKTPTSLYKVEAFIGNTPSLLTVS